MKTSFMPDWLAAIAAAHCAILRPSRNMLGLLRPALKSYPLSALFLAVAMVARSEAPAQNPPASPRLGDQLTTEASGSLYTQIEDSEYQIHWHDSTSSFMAPNRANDLRFAFHDEGFTVTERQPAPDAVPWSADLSLESYGRGQPAPIGGVSWSIAANTAEVKGRDISIGYRNDRNGLLQEFLIESSPPGKGPLRLNFRVDANGAEMIVDSRQNTMYIVGQAGSKLLMRYHDLKVLDANGKTLAAGLEQTGADSFAISVEDAGARYPVLVDPTLSNDGYEDDSGGHLYGYAVSYIVYEEARTLEPTTVINGGLLVGAPHVDNGSDTDAGEVYFYNTAGASLPSTPTWTYTGGQANELVGSCVADGGLMNSGGDYHVILVGAPGYGTRFSTNLGAVFGFYPSTSGAFASSPDWTVAGGAAGAAFGTSIAANIDLNDDGFRDVVIGAPYYENPTIGGAISPPSGGGGGTPIGQVCIYEGNSSGFNTTASWTNYGGNNSDYGFAVEWGYPQGDPGDSLPALFVGAPGGAGEVYEYLTAIDGDLPDTTPHATLDIGGTGPAEFGYSLCSRADQNGDGYQDLLVGAPKTTYSSMTNAGKIYLFQGGTNGLSTTAAWSAGGGGTNAEFGTSVAMGDMNGDTYADVWAGEPNMSWTTDSLTGDGYVNLYITSTTTYLPVYSTTVVGFCNYGALGTSVAYGPDLVNHDADLIVGAPGNSTGCSSGGGAGSASVQVLKFSP